MSPPPGGRRWRRAVAAGALGTAGLLATGCLELKGIEERLRVRAFASGHVAVMVAMDLPSGEPDTPLRRKADALRLAAESGSDAWSLRFARGRPLEERYGWTKKGGVMRTWERAALLPDVDGASRLLGDTAIRLRDSRGPGWWEIAVDTTPPLSGSEERRRLDEGLDRFSERVAAYMRSAVELYRYMDGNSHRADACLAAMASDRGEDGEEPELSPLEEALVRRWEEDVSSAAEMLDLLGRMGSEDLTLEELSRLVHDPFPADFVLQVPGATLEVEGFVPEAPGSFRAPRTRLGTAMLSLRSRWLSPDPLVELLAAREATGDADDVDLDAVLRRPRQYADAPTPAEVREALLAGLRPPPVLRVRFVATEPGEDAAEPADWWLEPEPAVPSVTASARAMGR